LCHPANETDKGKIYGVLPCVATEVLRARRKCGEDSTRQRPFDGHSFDLDLSFNIYRGLRLVRPEYYFELTGGNVPNPK
ncbi:2003_t:CDS:2, partial [Dentiscutata heterogama]